jgi:hypothetical protein
MPHYVVSYDLRKEPRDRESSVEQYARVHNALRTAVDFCWPLLSFWIIETPLSPRGVINKLLEISAIDDNDGIVVLEITGVGDFRRLEFQEAIDWLSNKLTRQ